MWIEEAVARQAAEAGPGYKRVRILERVVRHELFPTRATAPLALELPVEGIQGFLLRVELVREAFDSLPSQHRI